MKPVTLDKNELNHVSVFIICFFKYFLLKNILK